MDKIPFKATEKNRYSLDPKTVYRNTLSKKKKHISLTNHKPNDSSKKSKQPEDRSKG